MTKQEEMKKNVYYLKIETDKPINMDKYVNMENCYPISFNGTTLHISNATKEVNTMREWPKRNCSPNSSCPECKDFGKPWCELQGFSGD